MAKLERAITTLEKLVEHNKNKTTEAAKVAADKNFKKASQLLATELKHLDKKLASAAKEVSNFETDLGKMDPTKADTKRTASKMDFDKITTLKSTITESRQKIVALQATYTTAAENAATAVKANPIVVETKVEAVAKTTEATYAAVKAATPLKATTDSSVEEENTSEQAYDIVDAAIKSAEEEAEYIKALEALKALRAFNSRPDTNEDELLGDLLDIVEDLKIKGKTATTELNMALNATYARLTDSVDMDSKKYTNIANTMMQGKPSLMMKILGGIMLALAAATLVVGFVFFSPITAAAVGAGLTGIAAAALTGTGIAVSASALIGGSVGLFAKSGATGLSKSMSILDKNLLAQQELEGAEDRLYSAAPAA